MGDILRLVEEAQSREAPVQRLADKVLHLCLTFSDEDILISSNVKLFKYIYCGYLYYPDPCV